MQSNLGSLVGKKEKKRKAKDKGEPRLKLEEVEQVEGGRERFQESETQKTVHLRREQIRITKKFGNL